jgi:hypothetical protein
VRRLFVPLTTEELERLGELARAERRRPQDQAALILARTLATADPRRDATAGDAGDRVPRRRPPALAEAAR